MIVKQDTTAIIPVVMFDSVTGAPKTGIAAPTITLSKEGAAFAAIHDGTWAELGDGIYTFQVDTIDTNTVGRNVALVISAGADDSRVLIDIEAAVPVFDTVVVSGNLHIAADK